MADLEKGITIPAVTASHNASTVTLFDEALGMSTPTTEVDVIIYTVGSSHILKDSSIVSEKGVFQQQQQQQWRPPTPATAPDSSLLSPITPVEPPDGGLVAWCQVLAGFLTSSIAWGTSMMFGIYQLYYTQTLGLDSGAVSWVGSVQTFLTYLFSTVSGLLADAGYGRHVAAAGTLLVVAGGLGTSFAAPDAPATLKEVKVPRGVPPALFVSQAVVTGIGLGLLTAPALPSINGFFRRRRSLALALSTMGTSAGGALLPAVVQFLLPAVGFGWAMRCETLLALVVCANAALLLRQPPATTPATTTVMATATSTKAKRTLRSCVTAVGHRIVDWSALRELPFVLFLASSFMLYWGLYFGFYYINVYAEDVVGFSTNQATTLLILSTALGIPARVAAGAFADHVAGPIDTFVLTTVLLGATIFGWLAVGTSTPGMYVFVVAFGLCNGAVQSVWLGSLADMSKHAASRIGARFGMVCVVAAVATLAGAPTAEALVGLANGGDMTLAATYHLAQIWAAATTLASAGILVVARVYTVGWRLRRV